jgi:hypothetical protein
MLDLRTLDPARQSADRRVALVAGFGADAVLTFAAVAAGGGGWALAGGGALALAALPWYFAFGARWRLLDDGLDGVPFVWRGDRSGIWATAPAAGALATLLIVAALGFPPFLALLSCLAGAAAYTALIATAEARFERAILLDLTVLELRFLRITDTRTAQLRKGRGGVGASDRDLEVQVGAGGVTRGADAADLSAGGHGGAGGDRDR